MKKKVLIVEDEMIIALMLEQMVTKLGYEIVGKVSSGEMAVEQSIACRPDIILMDIRLQGEIDGIEAVTKIQESMDTMVIYITGNTDKMHKRRIEKTKYLDFLVKPVNTHQLSHSLNLAV
jgi:CheY-like chemotaxis protein